MANITAYFLMAHKRLTGEPFILKLRLHYFIQRLTRISAEPFDGLTKQAAEKNKETSFL